MQIDEAELDCGMPLAAVVVALVAATREGDCATDEDCSLNGVCGTLGFSTPRCLCVLKGAYRGALEAPWSCPP